jgi:hypothetical protein
MTFRHLTLYVEARFLIASLMLACAPLVLSQSSEQHLPKIADQSLTTDQLAVYRAILLSWFQGSKDAVNLNSLTSPIDATDPSSDQQCSKGLAMEEVRLGEVHRILMQDLAQLGPFQFHLVDPKTGKTEVSDNDPGRAIQNGKSVDEAVKNGFAHGLLTLGEIRFDKTHTHALASFSFVCGSLCGNGTTILLERKDGTWKRKSQCGGWVS